MPARGFALLALALALAACATLPRGASEEARMLAKLDRCGLDTRAGRVSYDPVGALVTVGAPVEVGAKETRCVARLLLDRGVDFQSADLGLAAGYAAAWESENATVGPRMARLWVRKNVKRPVPRFAPRRETLDTYVRKLERLCAAEPGSVTATADTVRVPWLADAVANDRVSCVYLAALASNLAENGIRIESAKEPSAS
jgi:hypothetical protein